MIQICIIADYRDMGDVTIARGKAMDEEEVNAAYEVLANHFGFSADYIKEVLEEHFEGPSYAALRHPGLPQATPWKPARRIVLRIEEVRAAVEMIDRMIEKGEFSLKKERTFFDRWRYNHKTGESAVLTDEQLEEEHDLDKQSGIDPEGNLWIKGKLVKRAWLQSHDVEEREEEDL